VQPNLITRLTILLRALGPYAAIELLLPGGSLIAISLWIFRHRGQLAAGVRGALSRVAALVAGFSRSGARIVVLGN
jgi:hypothetical protein